VIDGPAHATNLGWAAARPRVSVITIFLNAERFIEEAIESVLRQDYGDLELILVDDGSTDTSAARARSAAQRCAPFVRYVQHDRGQNRGMSASRNLGLSLARGEFVAFIDADDIWTPSKLREQLAIMQAHPELDMVCGAVRYWHSWAGGTDRVIPTGHVQDRVVRPPDASLALYPLGTASAPCPSDLLLRRTAVTAVGGFEEHFTGANQMYEYQGFIAKLYLRSTVYFSSKVWLSYRQHADSCVAEVTRTGGYHEVRRYFLSWFERYLAEQSTRSLRVRAALERARFPYAHPQLFRAAQLGKQAMRTARRLVRAL
jgi:glycosyltransferase involved in cell wall biosynthesis